MMDGLPRRPLGDEEMFGCDWIAFGMRMRVGNGYTGRI